jgi:hypothetical protein
MITNIVSNKCTDPEFWSLCLFIAACADDCLVLISN